MTYSPSESAVVSRIQRAFLSDELRERARATNLVERERKFDVVALFYTLSFGFAAGSDRTLQAFLERYVEMADCDELSYASFHEWFEPTFVALLREILDDAIENLDTGRADLNGRLDRFRDVLIADGTIVNLYEDATDVYTATGEDQAGLKLHLTESLSTALVNRWTASVSTVRTSGMKREIADDPCRKFPASRAKPFS